MVGQTVVIQYTAGTWNQENIFRHQENGKTRKTLQKENLEKNCKTIFFVLGGPLNVMVPGMIGTTL